MPLRALDELARGRNGRQQLKWSHATHHECVGVDGSICAEEVVAELWRDDVPAHMFEVGDYILRSIPGDTAERHQREKLLPVKVPMQVVMALSPSTYMCRDLATRALRLVLWTAHAALRGARYRHLRYPSRGAGTSSPCTGGFYSLFVDYAVLMDEPYLLANYVNKDQTSGLESEWISWREIKK